MDPLKEEASAPIAKAEVANQDNKDTELGDPLGDAVVEEPKKAYKDIDDWAADENEVDNADLYPLREVKFMFIGETPVSFNPVVSLIGIVCLWGVAIWCMADPEGSNLILTTWRGEVTRYFTWLFVGSKCVFFGFLLWIVYKYGHIKLGAEHEEPEFSTAAYFSMIFAAGVAVGLFVYGVSEPLEHQKYHFYANSGYHTQDEIDAWAINLTITHWNIAGWAPYLVVALAMGLAGHRFKLPMTFRACFYPILGDYTWGWIGDVIDGFTIVVTVAGVCTSLGLGAIQIVDGLQYLGWAEQDPEDGSGGATKESLAIWVVTAIATASVLSGLDAGIKFLSLLAFNLGLLLQFLVFTMDDTKYLMNLIVQEFGYFLQYSIFLMNFYTGAFAQLPEGGGMAIDGLSEHPSWVNWWPVFYQAWWVSWSAFVGLFVARISRGRTISEVVGYSLVAPCIYCIVWFCIWGGIGLRQARQALELQVLGNTTYGDVNYFQSERDECYDVPQETLTNDAGEVIFQNSLPGVTPVCLYKASGDAPFNVLHSFSYPDPDGSSLGLGTPLSIIFIFSLAIYFATSSDSGSLVVDYLASNGRLHHHWVQRLFWALTEGAVATALLSSGGAAALRSVQAASIVAGLPFVFLLCYLLQSIYLFVVQADKSNGKIDFYKMPFNINEFPHPVFGGVFNVMEYILSLGNVHHERESKGMGNATSKHYLEFIKGLFIPFVTLREILQAAYPKNSMKNNLVAGAYGLLYYTWIAIFIALSAKKGLKGVGWAFFFAAAMLLMSIRYGFRTNFNIRSNELGDFLASLFLWPQVLSQMKAYCDENDLSARAEEKYA